MCYYFSCIVTKTGVCLWLESSVSHEDIISKNDLNDTKLENRDFVRIEITPKDISKITRNKKDWQYKVDETGTLPDWYNENVKKYESLCWVEWQRSIKINLAIGEEVIEATDRYIIGSGKSKITGYGSSTMVGYGSSTMVGYGSSRMEGHDSSRMEGHDSSRMVGYGSSRMEGHDSSTMVGYGSSTMVGYGSSTMVGYGSSRMEGYGSSRMEGYDSSKYVIISKLSVAIDYRTGEIVVSEEAKVKVQG